MRDRAAGGPGAGSTPPWRYAIGMFGTSVPINMIKGSMLYFYVHVLGMSGAAYAAVYTIYGVIDAIDNPVFGYLSDRTRSRWGRRRPYLLAGAFTLLISMIALFWVPSGVTAATTGGLVAWFAVFAILSEMSDSLINSSYGALLPELFPQERRRAVANSLRQGFQLLALIIATGLTPLLARSVLGCEVKDPTCADPTSGYRWLAVIYGVGAALIIVYMAVGVHENPGREAERRPRFLTSIGQILTNKYFWTIGAVCDCYTASMVLVLNGLQFYVEYSLGGTALDATILQVTVIVAAGVCLALWTVITRLKGAAWAWKRALPLATVLFIPLYFAESVAGAVVAGILMSFGHSGMLATNDLIFARVLDADAHEHGVHREGIFLSAFGVLGRLSAIPTSLALVSLAWLFDYRSGSHPGADPGTAWRVYMSVYPFVLMLIATIISRFITVPDDTPLAGERS